MNIFPKLYTDNQGFIVQISQERDGITDFYPYGGGFRMSMPTTYFHQHFHLFKKPLELKPVNVTMDCTDESFPALAADLRWNGWVVPYFRLSTAIEVLQHLDIPHKMPSKGVLLAWDEGSQTYETAATKTIDGKTYYNVMDGWCWELADLMSDEEEGA